jgi:hypothetical protein
MAEESVARVFDRVTYQLSVEELQAKFAEAETEADKQFYQNWLDFRLKQGYYAQKEQQW